MNNHPIKLTRFDFDVWDFIGSEDVAAMNAEQGGQFIFLLCHAWLGGKDCTLPNDPALLGKLSRSLTGVVDPLVLKKFELNQNERLVNTRLLIEWKAAKRRARLRKDSAQKAGRASAEKRKGSQAKAGQEDKGQRIAGEALNECSTDAQRNSTPKPTQTNPSIVGSKEGGKEGNASANPNCSKPDLHESACTCKQQSVEANSKQESKQEPVLSQEANRLCTELARLLKVNRVPSAWHVPAEKIVTAYGKTLGELDQLIEMAAAAISDPFWTTELTGMVRFLTLLQSTSEKGLLPWYFAQLRKKEIKAEAASEPTKAPTPINRIAGPVPEATF